MNTLEVTYADKAGRLIDQSPDKKAIEDLKTAVQDLQGKALKIYYVEDATIGPDDLVDVEGLLEALAGGRYQAVHLKFDRCIYYVVYHYYADVDSNVQLVSISSNVLSSVVYYVDNETWILDDDPGETFTFSFGTVEPGTKLYLHTLEGFSGTSWLITNSNQPIILSELTSYINTGKHPSLSRYAVSDVYLGYHGGTYRALSATYSEETGFKLNYVNTNGSVASLTFTISTFGDTVTPL